MNALTEARRLFDAGVALLPNHPRDKCPYVKGWQELDFDWPTLERHIHQGGALGLRQGDAGGEAVDVDVKHWFGDDPEELVRLYEALVEDNAPGLLARLVVQRTQSGGRHYLYRCAVVEGNRKLAERPPTAEELATDPKCRAVTLIETRGTGGQVQIAPSPGYMVMQGNLAAIPTITEAERQVFHKCARLLNQLAEPSTIDAKAARLPRVEGETLPGDAYNANGGADEALRLLEVEGYTVVHQCGAVSLLRRPGKSRGISATFGYHGPGVLHAFSSNMSPFDPGHAYSPFAIRALLRHGGDYTECARLVAEEHGLPFYPAGQPLERDGVLCCPTHQIPLRQGDKAGWLFCSQPDPKGERGWCEYRARVTGDVPPAAVKTVEPEVEDDPRPAIDISAPDLQALAPQTWAAVLAQNDPPTLFRRAGELVRLEENDSGARVVKTVDARRMLGILARSARWVRVSYDKRGTPIEKSALPPAAVVDDCMVNIDSAVPVLTRVVHAPTFAAGNLLLTTPGYHAAARVYYDPASGTDVPPVPAQPSGVALATARRLVLDELLADFPFVSDADRAHAVALFLLPFVRELISGPTPLHLVEAPTMGSGKGLLAETLLMPALGDPPSAMAEATTDEEWGKTITAHLLGAPAVIYIDNLNRTLDSGSLAAALTAREFSDRVLGKSELVSLPVRCAWVATANNPTLSTEIARRCIRVRIDPRTDEPWKREQFRHPNLRTWVEQNRGRLIWAALVLSRYGLTHGKPGRALGSFEGWSDMIGRILNGCGIPGFLGNLDLLYARADAEGAAWRRLAAAWWEKHGNKPQAAATLYPLVEAADAEDLINGKEEAGRKKSFGKALARVLDRVFSLDCDTGPSRRLQITEGGTSHKVKLWRLVQIEEGGFVGLGGFHQPHAQEQSNSPAPFSETPPNTPNPATHTSAANHDSVPVREALEWIRELPTSRRMAIAAQLDDLDRLAYSIPDELELAAVAEAYQLLQQGV